eukprot:scaffold1917_cov112-Cylindrotheca_fusiformis.AAC.2
MLQQHQVHAPGVAFALPPQPPAVIRPPAGIPWMDQAAVEHCRTMCGLRTATQRASWIWSCGFYTDATPLPPIALEHR